MAKRGLCCGAPFCGAEPLNNNIYSLTPKPAHLALHHSNPLTDLLRSCNEGKHFLHVSNDKSEKKSRQ